MLQTALLSNFAFKIPPQRMVPCTADEHVSYTARVAFNQDRFMLFDGLTHGVLWFFMKPT
jgi:hypothetical protein